MSKRKAVGVKRSSERSQPFPGVGRMLPLCWCHLVGSKGDGIPVGPKNDACPMYTTIRRLHKNQSVTTLKIWQTFTRQLKNNYFSGKTSSSLVSVLYSLSIPT